MGVSRFRQVERLSPQANESTMRAAAGEQLLSRLERITEEAKTSAAQEAEQAALAKTERANAEARLVELERSSLEQAGAAREAQLQVEQSLTHVRESAARMRAELLEKDAETQRMRAEATLATAQHQAELERVRASLAHAEASAKAAAERGQQIIYQAPEKPKNIDFKYHWGDSGLLQRVVLKADGYEDVTVEVDRGPDNRMRRTRVLSTHIDNNKGKE